MANFSLCPHIVGDVGDFTGDSFIRSPILSTRMLNFRGRTANVQIKHPPSCWGCKPSLFLATQNLPLVYLLLLLLGHCQGVTLLPVDMHLA